jgi:hypothetical protein
MIKTYNPYAKILNFVLLTWEERNLGRYEHARACRARARAPRAPKNPPALQGYLDKYPALVLHYSEGAAAAAAAAGAFLCISYRGKLLQHKLIRVQCTKKVPEYRYPLYHSTGIRFKKVVLKG